MQRSTRTWLLSARAGRAYLQIGFAVGVEVMFRRATAPPPLAVIFVRSFEIILLLFPLFYFGGPIVAFAVKWLIAEFAREQPAYPCPVCGYDIRETPHRCPECGTKLRWGQLP